MHYVEFGEGKPLIFLHGWGQSHETFLKMASHFSSYHVYLLDLPGFGSSDVPLASTLDFYQQALFEFVSEHNIINPIIIGHSFGGRVGIKYASKHQQCKLILVDSAGLVHHGMKYYLKVYWYKLLKKLGIKTNMGSDDYKNAKGIMREVLINVTNESLLKDMRKINVETLIIFGENDTVTPLSDGHIMEENIKNSELVIIPRSGHFPYLENPSYFLIVVDSFLSSGEE